MSITVNVNEARAQFSRLLEQAHAGQEIILSKAGRPYARMVPLTTEPALGQAGRQAGRLAGRVEEAFFDPLPPEELDACERR